MREREREVGVIGYHARGRLEDQPLLTMIRVTMVNTNQDATATLRKIL
jgi:hypothetical protein